MHTLTALRTDVLVVGGGPAGLAAAIASRLKGFDVTVTDHARPPIDRACGEGILPAGVEALRRLGVPVSSDDGFAFRGIRILGGSAPVEAPFGGACGIAVRRTRLHEMLVHRAAELGVRLLWETTLRGTSHLLRCRWIVGADGQSSRVREEAMLGAARSLSTRFGFRRHYRLANWTDMVEVHWGKHCQIYVTPVARDEIGVALLSRDSHLRLDDALAEFPQLERRLRNARRTSRERGGATTTRRLKRVFRGHTVLIGDASGSVDAITGEGLSLAFLQASALADALSAGDLRAYQAEHRRLAGHATVRANVLMLLDRYSWLRRVVLQGLAFGPAIFSHLLPSA